MTRVWGEINGVGTVIAFAAASRSHVLMPMGMPNMHDLGPNQLEQNMNEFMQEGPSLYEGPYQGEVLGESPLDEILGQEAPLHEGAFESAQETPYQEVYEAPYQEVYEAPYGEATYHESPMHEAVFEDEALAGETSAFEGTWNEVLNEDEVLALTSELLEVQNEDEMDQFLGKLFRRVGRIAKGIMRSPIGKLAGGALRNVARAALPLAGKALGTFVGGPVGTMIGGQLANMAGQALGLELQEMSGQEADFAAARQFVRFATDFLRRAGQAPSGANPAAVVRNAVTAAAQKLAPGLLGRNMPRLPIGPAGAGRQGKWVQRGRTITLFGV